ncbi:MAG: lipocalin family protein [Bacteroidota bacterium]
MIKKILILSIFIALSACGSKDFEAQKAHIAGYWEIKSVEMGDGSFKEFDVATSVDYIEVSGDNGVRKKLMPKVDGTFTEFPTTERFQFSIAGDSLIMHYSTPFANWNETVLEASANRLVTLNKDGKRFEYERFQQVALAE